MLSSKPSLLKKQIQDLETENSELKVQLMEARAMIESLRQENEGLSKRLKAYNLTKTIAAEPENPISLSPQELCDNCNQEVPSGNISLHKIQCIKRYTKCKACRTIIPSSEVESHYRAQMGTFEDLLKDIESGSIEKLADREAHGHNFNAQDPGPGNNTLVHIAVKAGKRELVQFFLNKGLGINMINAFGETPLHVACGKNKDLAMVQFLVSKGADYKICNSMGDSPVEVAKRNGFHEAILYFQQKANGGTRPGTSGYNVRPGSVGNRLNRIIDN
jgi:regulator of replication initiation timing